MFSDVLERAAESERIKGSLAMLRQYGSLFRLPARIRSATAHSEFQQVVWGSRFGVRGSGFGVLHPWGRAHACVHGAVVTQGCPCMDMVHVSPQVVSGVWELGFRV